jgi:hypothetical protein
MEFWAQIEGFPKHQVSNLGRIRSITTRTNTYFGKILKTYEDKDGYLRLSLFKNGKKFPRYVHLLVAETFIPNPKRLPQANHKDGIRNNPTADNLEWRSDLGNKRHSVKSGNNKAKGVTFNKARGKWHAYYSPNGKKVYIGTSFPTEQAALAARKLAIEELPDVD